MNEGLLLTFLLLCFPLISSLPISKSISSTHPQFFNEVTSNVCMKCHIWLDWCHTIESFYTLLWAEIVTWLYYQHSQLPATLNSSGMSGVAHLHQFRLSCKHLLYFTGQHCYLVYMSEELTFVDWIPSLILNLNFHEHMKSNFKFFQVNRYFRKHLFPAFCTQVFVFYCICI